MVFGSGARGRIPEEIAALGKHRALLLGTSERPGSPAGQVADLLGGLVAHSFLEAAPHTPVEVTERALARAGRARADCVVAVGGGSAIGLGKAVSLRTGLPQLAVPTTYAGSEMTPILGETEDGRKVTRRLPQVRPATVVYDVDLTLTLPAGLSALSGLNALAHAVEALYAEERDPLTALMAGAAVEALARALPVVTARPQECDARAEALYGAWLAGVCLGTVGMALHHKLCHVLGGTFDLPHAETHAVLLPHVMAYNAPAAEEAVRVIMRTLPGPDAASALHRFAEGLGAPLALRDLGMPETGLDLAADLAVRQAYWNPRPVDRDAVRRLLTRAWAGEAPLSEPLTTGVRHA